MFLKNLKTNLEVVKFVIPLLILVLSLILISDFKTRKKSNDYIVFLIMLLFSFFNGLGVFTILDNDILGNVSVFLPVLLCTIGAVISVILILFLIFLASDIDYFKNFDSESKR